MGQTYTYDSLCAAMEETTLPHELWDGHLVREPAPTVDHQRMVARFYRALSAHVERHKLGEVFLSPVDVVLSQRQFVQPDVCFLFTNNLSRAGEHIEGPVDLAAEISFPGSLRRDAVRKRDLYAKHGVKEYWLLDARSNSITVFNASRGRYAERGPFHPGETVDSRLLPGFSVAADELFGRSTPGSE